MGFANVYVRLRVCTGGVEGCGFVDDMMSLQQKSLFDTEPGYEDPDYLRSQLITYIGNKRSLLPFIGQGVDFARSALRKERISFFDAFSGTGVVARYAKQYASKLVVNDLETYSGITNACYLSNKSEVKHRLLANTLKDVTREIQGQWGPGFITEMYAPRDEENITHSDRAFYTRRNAIYIDTARRVLDQVPGDIRGYLLAPLLAKASVHANTSGVFKGFYKNAEGVGQFGGTARNALTRILAPINLTTPVLSRYECDVEIYNEDANELVRRIDDVDVAYFDPPYNQHPYGSNYFMLNLICKYERPSAVSRVSGIPLDWNRSRYNVRQSAEEALFQAVDDCPAKFILISYNSEGFVRHERFLERLEHLGELSVMDMKYNTFRGCRNLRDRDIHVKEFLYLLDKRASINGQESRP